MKWRSGLTIDKDPDAVLDYVFEWDDWLPLGDSLAAVDGYTITVGTGLTKDSQSIENYKQFINGATLDKRQSLDKSKVSTVIVSDEEQGTVYVENTDYTLFEEQGVIVPLSSGSIAEGQILHVSYNYPGVLVMLSGGSAGTTYEVTCSVTTTNGLTDNRSISIKVVER